MRAVTAAGRRVERVRVVSDPPSDYARWLLAGTALNVAAGEDIRYLPRREAIRLQLPDHDFWIFDDDRLAVMHFDDDDRFHGAEIVTDPTVVARHRRWQDVAMRAATPYSDYTGTV